MTTPLVCHRALNSTTPSVAFQDDFDLTEELPCPTGTPLRGVCASKLLESGRRRLQTFSFISESSMTENAGEKSDVILDPTKETLSNCLEDGGLTTTPL